MNHPDYLAIAPLGVAAGLLVMAVKSALIGNRPVVPSLVDWWRGRHSEGRHPMGGWVCHYCGATGADLGEMPPMATTYDREHGSVTRSERW